MRAFKLLSAVLALLLTVSCAYLPNESPDDAVTTAVITDAVTEEPGIAVEGKTAGVVLDYFAEIAFGSEYGDSSGRLCRWTDTVIYRVTGEPTEDDLELVAYLCEKLNGIEGFPGIKEAGVFDSPNFEIMFVPRSAIVEEFSHATETCVGMSEYSWNTGTYEIIGARAAIDSAATEERNSTICEEFLQAMGLAMDSYSHRDSVFYQGKCVYNRPSELDFAMIRVLYHPSLRCGMTKKEALASAVDILEW